MGILNNVTKALDDLDELKSKAGRGKKKESENGPREIVRSGRSTRNFKDKEGTSRKRHKLPLKNAFFGRGGKKTKKCLGSRTERGTKGNGVRDRTKRDNCLPGEHSQRRIG